MSGLFPVSRRFWLSSDLIRDETNGQREDEGALMCHEVACLYAPYVKYKHRFVHINFH